MAQAKLINCQETKKGIVGPNHELLQSERLLSQFHLDFLESKKGPILFHDTRQLPRIWMFRHISAQKAIQNQHFFSG